MHNSRRSTIAPNRASMYELSHAYLWCHSMCAVWVRDRTPLVPYHAHQTSSAELLHVEPVMMADSEEAVSGEIFIQSRDHEENEGTLDEAVTTTLARDVKAILRKFVHVLIPVRSNKALLHDWDLWGPLLLCMTLALLLHGHASDGSGEEHTIHFVHVFLLVWGGAAVVTVNAQLLRGKVSFFQCVCTLGYCLLPLAIVLFTSRILLSFDSLPNVVFIIRMALNGVALVWSIWASLGFLSDYLPEDRKALAIYPLILFYFSISCLIATQKTGLF